MSMDETKKPYHKPEITSEKIFEQNALACSKCQSAPTVTISASCVRGATKMS